MPATTFFHSHRPPQEEKKISTSPAVTLSFTDDELSLINRGKKDEMNKSLNLPPPKPAPAAVPNATVEDLNAHAKEQRLDARMVKELKGTSIAGGLVNLEGDNESNAIEFKTDLADPEWKMKAPTYETVKALQDESTRLEKENSKIVAKPCIGVSGIPFVTTWDGDKSQIFRLDHDKWVPVPRPEGTKLNSLNDVDALVVKSVKETK